MLSFLWSLFFTALPLSFSGHLPLSASIEERVGERRREREREMEGKREREREREREISSVRPILYYNIKILENDRRHTLDEIVHVNVHMQTHTHTHTHFLHLALLVCV